MNKRRGKSGGELCTYIYHTNVFFVRISHSCPRGERWKMVKKLSNVRKFAKRWHLSRGVSFRVFARGKLPLPLPRHLPALVFMCKKRRDVDLLKYFLFFLCTLRLHLYRINIVFYIMRNVRGETEKRAIKKTDFSGYCYNKKYPVSYCVP